MTEHAHSVTEQRSQQGRIQDEAPVPLIGLPRFVCDPWMANLRYDVGLRVAGMGSERAVNGLSVSGLSVARWHPVASRQGGECPKYFTYKLGHGTSKLVEFVQQDCSHQKDE